MEYISTPLGYLRASDPGRYVWITDHFGPFYGDGTDVFNKKTPVELSRRYNKQVRKLAVVDEKTAHNILLWMGVAMFRYFSRTIKWYGY